MTASRVELGGEAVPVLSHPRVRVAGASALLCAEALARKLVEARVGNAARAAPAHVVRRERRVAYHGRLQAREAPAAVAPHGHVAIIDHQVLVGARDATFLRVL